MPATPHTAAADETARRLEAAADEVESTKKAHENALERRNRLIVDAVDGGLVQKLVAQFARVSQPHVVRVLGRGFGDVLQA